MTTLAVGGLNPFWEFLPWPGFDFELDLNSEFLAFKDRRRLHWKWQWSPSWSSWSTHKYFSLFSHRIGAKKEHYVSVRVSVCTCAPHILACLHSSHPPCLLAINPAPAQTNMQKDLNMEWWAAGKDTQI